MKRNRAYLPYLLLLITVVVANVLISGFYIRWDLTEEKRFTLAPATTAILKELQAPVYAEIYLAGDMPPRFKRLRKGTEDLLTELKAYSGDNLRFKFIDLFNELDSASRNKKLQLLTQRGIQPVADSRGNNQQKKTSLLFPAALLYYGDKVAAVQLLKGNTFLNRDEVVAQSIEGLEYEFATAVKKLTLKEKKKIAYIEGHGEAAPYMVLDMVNALMAYYDVHRVRLPEVKDLQGYDAIIVCKPDSIFSDADKIKIDQFVVKGGKALFFVDAARVVADSAGSTDLYVMNRDLKLDDLFFKWGIRLNQNVIQDLVSSKIMMNMGSFGGQPSIEYVEWFYYPYVNGQTPHPIVKNLDASVMKYVGTMDTVKSKTVVKTPLLFTSNYSRVVAAPYKINFSDELTTEITPEMFSSKFLPTAYLLEGKFVSAYAGRPKYEEMIKGLVKEDKEGKVLVVSDGDFILNKFDMKTRQINPAGFDESNGKVFANKDFVMNTADYMLDDKGVISVRTKEITQRPLDIPRLDKELKKWQFLNIALPLVLLVIFGFAHSVIRKRQYRKK